MNKPFSKISICAIIAVSIALNCSCNKKTTPSTTEEEVAATVTKMYDHIFECYKDGNGSVDEFNRLYLTADYMQMIDSVNAFDSLYCTDEIGFWSYDHWVMAQDWNNPTYTLDTVFVSDTANNWYWAEITIHNLGTDTRVMLLMMPENSEWKIGEMLNYDWDTPSEFDRIHWYFQEHLDLKKTDSLL